MVRSMRKQAIILAGLLALPPALSDAQVADHMKCYRIRDPLALKGVVNLDSPQFGVEPGCKIAKPYLFCVPVTKTVVDARDRSGPIQPIAVAGPDPGDRICYRIKCSGTLPAAQQVSDQFGSRTVEPVKAYTLCTPAVKGPPTPFTVSPTCEDAAANVILDCDTAGGYVVTSKLGPPPVPGAPVLRIIGIYETYASHAVTGEATVNVKRPERTVLVLSSYESVHWTVNVFPGAVLERVILFGYEPQTATAPAGVPIENHSPDFDAPCGHSWPYNGGGCDTNVLIATAEQFTGLCLTSFHGCYTASRFSIPAGNVGSPDGAFVD